MWRFLWVTASALAYATLFAPLHWSWLSPVVLVPLLMALHALSWRQRALAGACWGLVSNFAVGHWVPAALTFYYGQPAWFGVLFCAGASLVYWTPYYVLFSLLAGVVRLQAALGRVVVLAALWVSVELARAGMLTGAPWALLGHALVPHTTLLQVVDLGGVYVLSFLLLLSNAAVVEMVRAPRSRQAQLCAAMAVAAVAIVFLYGRQRLVAQPLPVGPAVRTVLVQGNNQEAALWQPGAYGRGLEEYLRLSTEAVRQHHPQVLIWPEAAVTMFLGREPHLQARIGDMLAATGSELLLGAPHYLDGDPALPEFRNSAFYLKSDGQITGRYDKRHLLPFAEYFPLRTIALLRRRFERVRTFIPGDGPALLDTAFGRTAVVICFEGIFADLVRRRMKDGAEVLVVLSNDVWLGQGAGPAQHLDMVIPRAVENRSWMLRATTTGTSAVVDPFGRVVAVSESMVTASLPATVTPLQTDTVYKRYGDLFALACVMLTTLAIAHAVLRRAE